MSDYDDYEVLYKYEDMISADGVNYEVEIDFDSGWNQSHKVGGMGVTYLLREISSKELFVLKHARPKIIGSPEDATAVTRNEIEILKRLEHTEVVPKVIAEFDVDYRGDKTLAFIQSCARHQNLRNILDKHGGRSLVQDGTLTNKILPLILEAVYSINKCGILHQDLDADHIWVDRDNQITIIDWGGAAESQTEGTSVRAIGSPIMGKDFWSPPEQLSGSSYSDASEVFHIGAIAFYLLTGRAEVGHPLPYDVHVFNPDVDEKLRNLIVKATEENPRERIPTIEDFLNLLQGGTVLTEVPRIVVESTTYHLTESVHWVVRGNYNPPVDCSIISVSEGVSSPYISREHCVIELQDGYYRLKDKEVPRPSRPEINNSTNGTYYYIDELEQWKEVPARGIILGPTSRLFGLFMIDGEKFIDSEGKEYLSGRPYRELRYFPAEADGNYDVSTISVDDLVVEEKELEAIEDGTFSIGNIVEYIQDGETRFGEIQSVSETSVIVFEEVEAVEMKVFKSEINRVLN